LSKSPASVIGRRWGTVIFQTMEVQANGAGIILNKRKGGGVQRGREKGTGEFMGGGKKNLLLGQRERRESWSHRAGAFCGILGGATVRDKIEARRGGGKALSHHMR